MIEQSKLGCNLELGGGIDATTARLGVDAGENVLVAGSSILDADKEMTTAMNKLRAVVEFEKAYPQV
jgi:pentose-5-phosphate-3-epimerase